jgi:membrane protein implicated in regulation of membrane protease activity
MSLLTPLSKPKMLAEPLIGIVDRAVLPNQAGRVKCQATYWPAKLYQPDDKTHILPGQSVTVVGIEGNTLLIVPMSL